MRKSIQAYASIRTGQDMARPVGNFGAFYSSLLKYAKFDKTKQIKRFAAIRQNQEQARPNGNFGAFYFKRKRAQ